MGAFEPTREKTNTMDSALSIDPDQPKHVTQANPDRHCSPPVDFLFQEALLYTSISLGRLIWVDTLRRCHNVGFLAGRLICVMFNTSYILVDVLDVRNRF